jgi:hypothetical protein
MPSSCYEVSSHRPTPPETGCSGGMTSPAPAGVFFLPSQGLRIEAVDALVRLPD